MDKLKKNALKIVCFLIAGKLRKETFLLCLNHIDQSYYDDAVEERVINNMCGYSLCEKKLVNSKLAKKKFFIDWNTNKCIDITQRKKFCSNFCFAASEHIKEQIKTELCSGAADGPEFTVLTETPKNVYRQHEILSGKESLTEFNLVWSRDKATEEPNKANNSLESEGDRSDNKIQMPESSKKLKPTLHLSPRLRRKFCTKNVNIMPTIQEDDNENSPKLTSSSPLTDATQLLGKNQKPQESNIDNVRSVHPTKINNEVKIRKCDNGNRKAAKSDGEIKFSRKKEKLNKHLETIQKCIFEWVTIETYIFLYGENDISKKLKRITFLQSEMHASIIEEEILEKNNQSEPPSKEYYNNFDAFDAFDDEVKCFPEGNKKKENEFNADYNLETSEDILFNTISTITSVHKKRYDIFLKFLCADKSITLLGIFSRNDIANLKLMVKTFNLQSHNITFEPFVIKIINIILFKMLGIRDAELKIKLESCKFGTYVKLICEEARLDKLLKSLEDPNLFLDNRKHL